MIDQKLLSDAQAGNIEAQFNVGFYYATNENGDINHAEAARWYHQAARGGHALAQNKLANMLIDGVDGVPQDVSQSIYWYTEAAKQGDAGAQYNLAWQYYNGNCIEIDYQKAMAWFEKAADQGNADAYYYLGCGYFHGEGYSQDLVKGIELWEKSLELGSTKATFILGLAYYLGLGAAENKERAFILFSKAAENNDSRAFHYLGDCFRYGYGTDVDLCEAIKCYKKSADMNNGDGQYKLAICYDEGIGVSQDKDKAFELFHIAADSGNDLSQHKLGVLYMTDRNKPPSAENLAKSAQYLDMAAEQGNDNAKFLLYKICMMENHPSYNPQKGLRCLIDLTKKGYSKAQFELGMRLFNGTDIKRDIDEGVRLITLAAETGDFDAMIYLGHQYRSGDIVQKDNERAVCWFKRAAELRPENDLVMMEIAQALSDEHKFFDAVVYFKKAIDLGNPLAPLMAFIVQAGCGDILLDELTSDAYEEYLEALELFKKIPDSDKTEQVNNTLSEVYLNIGTVLFFKKADEEALFYLKKAAEAGKPFANILRAEINLRNASSSQHTSIFNEAFAMASNALRFHEQFTPMQRSLAFYYVSQYYIYGIGGAPRDHNKAYELLNIAAAQESRYAKAAQTCLSKFRKKLFGGYVYDS